MDFPKKIIPISVFMVQNFCNFLHTMFWRGLPNADITFSPKFYIYLVRQKKTWWYWFSSDSFFLLYFLFTFFYQKKIFSQTYFHGSYLVQSLVVGSTIPSYSLIFKKTGISYYISRDLYIYWIYQDGIEMFG